MSLFETVVAVSDYDVCVIRQWHRKMMVPMVCNTLYLGT